MMIKIIKPGKKDFHAICNRCGCEFTYEAEDINLAGFVECPTCGGPHAHSDEFPKPPNPLQIGWPTPGEAIPCNTYDPCKDCDWYNKMIKDGATYIGDTPCTWCDKNKFRSTNLGTKTDQENFLKWAGTKLSDYTTPCVGINTTHSLNFDDCGTKACNNKSTKVEV
jgi:hypothetical protein